MFCPNGHPCDPGSRFCETCGAQVASGAPADTILSTPPPAAAGYPGAPSAGAPAPAAAPGGQGGPGWLVPTAVVVGVLGVVALVVSLVLVVGGGGSETATDSGDEAVSATTVTTTPTTAAPTTVPATTAAPTTAAPTTAPPPTAAPTTGPSSTVAARPTGDCPAEVRSGSGDNGATVVRRYTTEGYTVSICDTFDGYWYYGRRRSSGADIAVAAVPIADGYRAREGDTVYTITSTRLTAVVDGELVVDQPVL